MANNRGKLSRRSFIGMSMAGAATGLAGCIGDDDDEPEVEAEPILVDRLSDESVEFLRDTHMRDHWEFDGERPSTILASPVSATDPQLENASEAYGVDYDATRTTQPEIITQMLTGAQNEYDALFQVTGFMRPILESGNTQDIPRDEIPRWVDENIHDLFKDPSTDVLPKFTESGIEQLASHLIWDDPDAQENFRYVPYFYNMDSIGYTTDDVELQPEEAWGALFDDEYAGHVCLSENQGNTVPHAMMYLNDTGVIDSFDLGAAHNPSQDEVDVMVDFLEEQADQDQFAATWEGFAESVSIMDSADVWIGNIWEPAMYALRAEGVPTSYLQMPLEGVQGYLTWLGCWMVTDPGASDRNNLHEAYAWINSHFGGWYPRSIAIGEGYSVPHWQTDYAREFMGPELHNWVYGGEATYQPADSDTFLPRDYEWSDEEGEPDADGAVHPRGSSEERIPRTGAEQHWPDESEYITDEWDRWLT